MQLGSSLNGVLSIANSDGRMDPNLNDSGPLADHGLEVLFDIVFLEVVTAIRQAPREAQDPDVDKLSSVDDILQRKLSHALAAGFSLNVR